MIFYKIQHVLTLLVRNNKVKGIKYFGIPNEY